MRPVVGLGFGPIEEITSLSYCCYGRQTFSSGQDTEQIRIPEQCLVLLLHSEKVLDQGSVCVSVLCVSF